MLFCVIRNSTKGSEMLCQVFMWWIFFSTEWDGTSFFPEGGFSVRMAAMCMWMPEGPFLTPLWCLLSHEMVYPGTAMLKGSSCDGHSFLSCLSPSVDFCSPWGNIQPMRTRFLCTQQVQLKCCPSPRTQAALSIPSACFLRSTSAHRTPSWLCPASSPCFGFSLPTISQSKSYASTFNWNITPLEILIQIIFLYKN